jgi:ABC-type branched-subunit amino acid transport system substrate-binding protein
MFSSSSLHFGHSVVLMDKWDPEGMLRLIDEYKCTTSHMVPTQFHRMLALPDEVKDRYDCKHQAKYKKAPGALTMLGYDAALVLFDAIRRSPSLKGSDLRDAIAATKNFKGVTGNITLDAERNAVKSAVVLRIKNGRDEYMATVNP